MKGPKSKCKTEMGRMQDGGNRMKGYVTANGYMGLVEGRYMLFSCEEEYEEYLAA